MLAPADPLGTPVGQLSGWLEITGCCERLVYYPPALMAREFGPDRRLAHILPKLRCASCGRRPTRFALCERQDAGQGMGGAAPGWRVELS